MEEIYKTLCQDLGDIEKVVELLDALAEFGKELIPEELKENSSPYVQKSIALHKLITEGHQGSIKIPGALLLYLAGRFEDFVRVLFEELSIKVANNFSEFTKLPTNMQKALIKDTSEVISDPRKYGHGDGARDTFIKNLAENIHSNNLSNINYQCLSITTSNMRPEIIAELFAKVGLKEIWKKTGEQAKVKTHFGTDNSQTAENECKKYLENLMDNRNKIAHPSGSFTWPSNQNLRSDIQYFKVIGNALLEICEMYIAKLTAEKAVKEGSVEDHS
jgi:hypothetical protein